MVDMQGYLFVACVPFTFYATTQIAVIDTSAAKVVRSVETFERCTLASCAGLMCVLCLVSVTCLVCGAGGRQR
jgi:hypothetical protein